jgi:hypothetical protein
MKVLTHNPLSDDPRYAAHTLHGAVAAYRGYQNFLLYGDLFAGGLTVVEVMALWIAMAAAAIALRSRAMKFGLAFLIVSMLPVCLIVPRNGYMMYIPVMGWALYIGALFRRACYGLLSLARLPHGAGAVVRVAVLAAVAAPVMHRHAELVHERSVWSQEEQRSMRRFVGELRKVHPKLARGSTLLLVDDPLREGYYLLFMAQLAYADPALTLYRTKMMNKPPSGDELTRYDYVLGGGWDVCDVRGVGDMRPPVEVRFNHQTADAKHYMLDRPEIEIPEFAGKTVDLTLRFIRHTQSDHMIVRNVALDESGGAELAAPVTIGSVARMEWVRPAGGNWMSVCVH